MTSADCAVLEPRATTVPQRKICIPPSYNYIGVFLTFRCPYRCSYCINHHNGSRLGGYREISGHDWIDFFARLESRDIPITLQGGEPGSHPDFIEIVRATSQSHSLDILTNLAFDLRAFVREVDPQWLNREAPYAPIRVSYHPEQFSLQEIIHKIQFLQNRGFRVGLYGVLHPDQLTAVEHARQVCKDLGLDFRTKPFLGWHEGRLHGQYAYPEACSGKFKKRCECMPSELLLAPDGTIHRCHAFLYNRRLPLAHMGEKTIDLSDDFIPCDNFGQCNPCDVKIKNNRFQQFGHIAARIRNISQ